MPSDERKPSNPVQSLSRGLRLLELLAESSDGLALSDLSQRAGLAPSTTHRLLHGLEQHGFAAHDGDRGLWHVGVQAFTVGSAFLRGRSFVAMARAPMRALVEAAGETVNLAVEDGGAAVYLAQVECQQLMRAFAQPGARVPLYCSGVGKALLAALPIEERVRALSGVDLVPHTARTLTERDVLMRDLALCRDRGFAIDDEEHAVGLRCVAATLHDEAGEPLAALSISGPAARVTGDRLEPLGRMVAEACAALTTQLGGRLPRRAA